MKQNLQKFIKNDDRPYDSILIYMNQSTIAILYQIIIIGITSINNIPFIPHDQ